jgi:predicted Zn finger-like uncharacterized protein
MTLTCPSCATQYRVDPAQAAPGRKVRCRNCAQVFAVPGPSDGRLVLVADEPREFRDLVQRTLEAFGCRVETSDDGEAAFRFAVANRPALIILNVYLKRMLGVAVCEAVKGSPDLRGTRVVLVGTVFKSDRFIRAPGNLYGADDYFENVITEEDLRGRLARLLGHAEAGVRPGTLPGGARGIVPPLLAAGLDPEEEIRRLARIMISDLKMYYPEGFHRALLQRNFAETFQEELRQARDLIARRFPRLPQALQILAGALKEGLGHERDSVVEAADR